LMKKLVRMNGISDPEDGGQNLNVHVQDQEGYFNPEVKEMEGLSTSTPEITEQPRKSSHDQNTSPSNQSSLNTSCQSSSRSSGRISPPGAASKSSDQSSSGLSGCKQGLESDVSKKSSKLQGRRSSDISRSSQSKSPKKNESDRKKISCKKDRSQVVITGLEETILAFDDHALHSSTAIGINHTSKKHQVSSLPSTPLQEKSPPLGSTPIDRSDKTIGVGRSPPTTRTSPIATPSMSFKRSNSGKISAGGYISEFSIASSNNSVSDKRTKRKSWINNALNPTYTSKCEDLRKNFPGLPVTELLLGDYSCALQKEILVHGRMYVTTNFLCFYANLWKWETAVSVKWKDVSAMTKEKTALVIPNAIQICTSNEKLFFCSFTARDKAHVTLFKVWQNALMDCPASEADLWSWAQAQYGDTRASSSGKTSDVEYDASNDGGSNQSFDGLDPQPRGRLYSNIEEENEENKLAVNEGSFLPDTIGDKPLRALPNKSESLPTDMSDNSESETQQVQLVKPRGSKAGIVLNSPSVRPGIVSTDILTYEAWRQTKVAKEVLNTNFTLNIDDLFTLLFTNSKFFYDFQAERKTFDIVQCPWQQSETSDEKFRKVEFTLNLNHAMGPRTSRATEVQTMRANSVPGHIYNVDVETTNADIPYAEYFSVQSHYCIVKVNENECRLTVLCDIKYKKSPWGIIKSFIDKNVWAGIDEHFTALSSALEREVTAILLTKQDSVCGGSGGELPNAAAIKKKTRKQRARKISVTESAGCLSGSGASKFTVLRPPTYTYQDQSAGSHYYGGSGESLGGMNAILLCFLIMFCLLNMLLLYKFWTLEQQVVNKIDLYDRYRIDEITGPMELPKSNGDWLNLIRKQEHQHAKDLEAWQQAVKSAADLLKQTENAMSMFSRTFQADTNRKLLKHFLHQQAVEDHIHNQQELFHEQQEGQELNTPNDHQFSNSDANEEL